MTNAEKVIKNKMGLIKLAEQLGKEYNWVLGALSYSSIETLTRALKPTNIDPAIQYHNEVRLIKARERRSGQRMILLRMKGWDNQSFAKSPSRRARIS